MSPLLRRLASPRLSLQTHRPLCPDVITSAAHRKSVFSSISLPPKYKLFRRKVNQASSQFAHRPSLGTMKCSFTVPMPASVYLRRLQTGSTDTSFRCVALFPAEPTSFWPSEGKGTLFNVAAFHLSTQTDKTHSLVLLLSATRPDFEELLKTTAVEHLPTNYIPILSEILNQPDLDLTVLLLG